MTAPFASISSELSSGGLALALALARALLVAGVIEKAPIYRCLFDMEGRGIREPGDRRWVRVVSPAGNRLHYFELPIALALQAY